jgi:hypothetical protein
VKTRRWEVPLLIALGVAALLAASGCTSPGVKIATLVNVREYHAARYTESCRVEPFPSWCKPKYDQLQVCRKAIEEAGAAFQRGGKFPLQMKAARKACSKL